MVKNMELTNIYRNIIVNIETFTLNSLLRNNGYQTKHNNKYYIQINGLDHANIVYFSTKYEKYLFVSVKSIYDLNLFNPTDNNKLIYNPIWLDLYYDTIFCYNIFNPSDDELYYKYFGDKITGLLTIPMTIYNDTIFSGIDKTNYGLYYNENISMAKNQYTLDIPDDINTGNGTMIDNIYHYDTVYTKAYLGKYDIHNSLTKLYNFEISPIILPYLVNINQLSLFINNDQTLLASSILANTTIDAESILGIEVCSKIKELLAIVFNIDYVHNPLVNIVNNTTITNSFNYGEYLFFNNLYSKLDLSVFQSILLTKKYENIFDIVEQVQFYNNHTCKLMIEETPFIFRKNDLSNNNFIKIPVEYLIKLYASKTKNSAYPKISIFNNVNNSSPAIIYNVTKFNTDTTSLISYELLEKQNVEFVNYLPIFKNVSQYSDFLTWEDSTVANRLELIDYDIKLNNFKVNNFLYTNNIVNDANRFIVSGLSINLDTSLSSAISELGGVNSDEFIAILKKYVNKNKIDAQIYPLPILSNNINTFLNINTGNTINTINNETIYTENYIKNMYINGFNFIDVRNDINNLIDNPASTLGVYDRSIYNIYNKAFSNFDLLQLRNQQIFNVIYMITDTFTGIKDFIKIDLLKNPYPILTSNDFIENDFYDKSTNLFKHAKENFNYQTKQNLSAFFSNYENTPYNEETSFKTSLFSTSKYINKLPIFLKEIVVKNGGYLNGEITKIQITNAKVYDGTTYSVIDIILDSTEFVIENRNIVIDLTAILPAYKIMEYLDFEIFYKKFYKAFDYNDLFAVVFNFNFNNFQTSQYYNIKASFVANGLTHINKTRINTRPPANIECLPQEVYNETITAEIFDINDYIWNYVPDNTQCILLNNYIGNNYKYNLNKNIFDSTNIDLSEVAIVDRTLSTYVKYIDQYKTLPFFTSHESIGKYIRIYFNLSIPEDSTNIFEIFNFINLYNISLNTADGVLFMEGKISDYTEDMDFSDMLKLYRTELIWSIQHNIVNTIQSPILVDITCKIYNNKNDYELNQNSVNEIINDFFNITIYNRGDHIKQDHTFYPKFLNHIEFFEINPEYDWQDKKDYIYTIEYHLFSDYPDIKVSELYFDIMFKTTDLKFGIPVDYTNLEDVSLAIEYNQIDDKEEILYYFNQLIRNKCKNCTDTHISIKLKCVPELFGFNIGNFTIGSYTYNVKLEDRIPYIYYKEIADAVMILDKKSEIELTDFTLPNEIRENLQGTYYKANNNISSNDFYLQLSGYCGTVSVPKKTKAYQLMFNSSLYSKKIKFTLINNTSDKIINNIEETFSFPALDFRIINFTEDVLVTDYTNGYSGGLATYKVEEISEQLDTTTVIANEVLQLAIPSYDESMSRILSFMDKSAKLIEIKYKHNDNVVANYQPTPINIKNTKVQVVSFNNDILTYEQYGQLLDIDRRFYIERKYEVILDKANIIDFIPYFEAFDPQIQIKIPISSPKIRINATIEKGDLDDQKNELFQNILTDSTGVNEDNNNYYDLDRHYLYLIGERTDLNKFTFTLSGFLYYENNDILEKLIAQYYNDKLYKYGFTSTKQMFNPILLLELLFGAHGTDMTQYVIDTFITCQGNTMYNFDTFLLDVISKIGDRFKGKKQDYYSPKINMSSLTTLEKNAVLNYLTEEQIITIQGDVVFNIASQDKSTEYIQRLVTPFINDMRPDSLTEDMNILLKIYTTPNYKSSNLLEDIKSTTASNYLTPDQIENGQENWTFDQLYEILSYSGFSQLFNKENIIKFKAYISRTDSLNPIKYNFKADLDGSINNLLSIYLGEPETINDVGYLLPENDTLKLFNTLVPIEFVVNSMTQNSLNLSFNNKIFSMKNIMYPLQQSFNNKILTSPLQLMIDTKKFIIVQDSNYKKWFEIPINILKGIDAYLTIDKIKVVDNYISNNEYHLTFNTLNERYIIKGTGEKIIGKNINKFEHGITIKLEVFNIANTTGAYNTSILIYYSLNGIQYVETADIFYDIILPNVLDNEYLIIDIDRLDYTPPTFTAKTLSGNITQSNTRSDIFEGFKNVFLGGYGCIGQANDFIQHKDGLGANDLLNLYPEGVTSNGLLNNIDDFKDL